jgi:hypothetical protein
MAKYQKARFLCRLISFRAWPHLLLHRHLERCPECQKGLAGVEEARRATIPADRIGPVKDFWPEFALSLEREKSPRKPSIWFRHRWWLGTAGLVAAGLALAVVLLTGPPPPPIPELTVKIWIQSVRIYDEPAQAYIFQTPDVNRTFVWVEQINKGEKP